MAGKRLTNTDVVRQTARIAALSRHGAAPEEITAARAELDRAKADREVRERLIRAAVAAAPPLTVEQIERLRDLLATPAERLPRVIGETSTERAA